MGFISGCVSRLSEGLWYALFPFPQTAASLHKAFPTNGPYYCWRIMSILMQVGGGGGGTGRRRREEVEGGKEDG